MWAALDFGFDLLSLSGGGSSCDIDPLSLLDTKAQSRRETPLDQSLPPFILTLDLHRNTEITPAAEVPPKPKVE